AVIHTMLSREFDTLWTFDRSERDLLRMFPLPHRNGKECLVANIFLMIHQCGLHLHSPQAGIKADACFEICLPEGMRRFELRDHWAPPNHAWVLRETSTEKVFGLHHGHRLPIRH